MNVNNELKEKVCVNKVSEVMLFGARPDKEYNTYKAMGCAECTGYKADCGNYKQTGFTVDMDMTIGELEQKCTENGY